MLSARGICRTFPGVRALDSVDLTLRAGEVHALMGQNGAGKSTLIKVLTGVERPESGTIELDGREIAPRSPAHAVELGIGTVYQEVNLCPNLSVAENIYANRYPRRALYKGGGIDWRQVNGGARATLSALEIDVDVTRQLSSYSVAIQQMVAIARATSIAAKVLILDEPTSSLDASEVEQLFAVVRRLRERDLAILFVTHFLDQVYAVADRITVLRNGKLVGEYAAAELDHGALVAAMVGREVSISSRRASAPQTQKSEPPVIEARGLARRGYLQPIDVDLARGEILGIAGLLGSGRTELARLIFGLDRATGGEIKVDGQPKRFDSPADAIACGIALLPEERKTDGIVAELSVRENIVLALQARTGLRPYLSRSAQDALAAKFIEALGIKTASADTPIGQLSGGNQQKALLARWLAIEPRVLILDEPTRGIDVGAKQEILERLSELARQGMSIVFISAEIEELLSISHRLLVLRDRKRVGELPGGSDEAAVFDLIARHE